MPAVGPLCRRVDLSSEVAAWEVLLKPHIPARVRDTPRELEPLRDVIGSRQMDLPGVDTSLASAGSVCVVG